VLESTNATAKAILMIFMFFRYVVKVMIARLLCDAVVKCFNFGVDNLESTLTPRIGCGGLPGRYCLDELRDHDTAFASLVE